MMYNYKYGDGSVVDESSANFKKMGEDRKMAKKESVGQSFRSLNFEALSVFFGDSLFLNAPPQHL